MASYGNNTFKGVTFGIETTGNQGVPDFPEEHIYAKRTPPYGGSGATILQYAGEVTIGQIELTVIVHEDDWAAFNNAANFTAGTLVWTTRLGRANKSCRLLGITNKRQFPDSDYWRASARFEG